jgi:glycine/D-amino acid oxidase-like deaminating enzyme
MVAQALRLWRENEERFQRRMFRRTGVLWMAGREDSYEQAALPLLRQAGIAFEELTRSEAAARYPQVNFEDVARAILEKDAGYLLARRSCQIVMEGFQAEGGEYRQASATPGAVFGTPAGDSRFQEDRLPIWIDHGERVFYGIPGNEWRGFKVADDTHGPAFDPSAGERIPTPAGLMSAREYLARRFPGLKGAPLVEARVCQYENSPDSRFIIDRLPDTANAWIVGGGSGRGFKHGPAVGERVADLVLGSRTPDPFFALARFAKQAGRAVRQTASDLLVKVNSRDLIAGTTIRPAGTAAVIPSTFASITRGLSLKRRLVAGWVIFPFSIRNRPSRVRPVSCKVCGLTVRMYQKRVTRRPRSVPAMSAARDSLPPSRTRLPGNGVASTPVLPAQ